MSLEFVDIYENELKARHYRADPAQKEAAELIAKHFADWRLYLTRRKNKVQKLLHSPSLPQSLYIWGGVGRGKTFLMDLFFHHVPVRRKWRVHFHEFMRQVHEQLHAFQGKTDPLKSIAKDLANRYRLVCFDEFFISDVADALILHALLTELFNQRVVWVMTSNFHPDGLYADGLHRQRVLAAIELMKTHMMVWHIDLIRDYRQLTLTEQQRYFLSTDAQTQQHLTQIFEQFAGIQSDDEPLLISGRQIFCVRKSQEVVWFTFAQLCQSVRSQNDYLDIAKLYRTLILSDIPCFYEENALEVKRFMWLIDVLYDKSTHLVLSAQAPIDALYQNENMKTECVRTLSRLREMCGDSLSITKN